MTSFQRILLCLIAIALGAVGVQLVKARTAAAAADRALVRLASVQQQIASIERLDSQAPDWAQRTRTGVGPGGLAAAVNDALAASGVSASALASLSPAAESPISMGGGGNAGGGGLAGLTAFRRRAVLTLAPVTLPQVGKVLSAWRQAHPDWTFASVDITPEPLGRKDSAPAGGSDLPLRAVISIESLYVGNSASGTGASS